MSHLEFLLSCLNLSLNSNYKFIGIEKNYNSISIELQNLSLFGNNIYLTENKTILANDTIRKSPDNTEKQTAQTSRSGCACDRAHVFITALNKLGHLHY